MIDKRFSVLNSHERAKIVSFFTCFSSMIYHIGICITFFALKVYPMFFFNFISIAVFITLCVLIPRRDSYIALYLIASAEVIIHQILATYFLGIAASFHFFILLMGLLPFLVFEDKFKISVPITIITSLLYILLEISNIQPKYQINETALYTIRVINITLTVLVILFMVCIYTLFVYQVEGHLRRQNNNLERELKLASNIQQNFFSRNTDNIVGWDIGFVNQPMAGVSGDLYDVYKTKDRLDGFGIFDVSGHGISSGLVTMLVKNIIHQEFYKEKKDELWETMLRINDRVIDEKGDIENYLTGILAKIHDDGIEIVNASHPLPLVYRRATDTIEIIDRKSNSLGAIGIRDFPTFYESQMIKLNKGDELLLYTDGVTDCLNMEKEEYGLERFKESFLNVVGISSSQQLYLMLNDINDFRGQKDPNDDITLMIIKKKYE